MAKELYNIKVYLNHRAEVLRTRVTFITQDSEAYQFIFHIKDYDGNALDLSDASYATIKIQKPDAEVIINNVIISDAINGILTYDVGTTELTADGTLSATIQIYNGAGSRNTTQEFTFDVKAEIVEEGAIPSETEYGILTTLIDDVTLLQTNSEHPVKSVNGEIGIVVLDTDDVLEGVGNKYYPGVDSVKLASVEDGATSDQTDEEIKSSYEANPDTNPLTDSLKAKLEAIDVNATDDQTGAEIKALYELENNTNNYSDAEKAKLITIQSGAQVNPINTDGLVEGGTNKYYPQADEDKLSGIEAGAQKNLTQGEVKTAYENNANTNAYTDVEKAKLAGIADDAEANDVNTTLKGNTFNGNSELIETTIDGKLPALDGSLLTNVPAATVVSVNAKVGVVVLDTDDILEGAAKFYSDSLVDANPKVVSNSAKIVTNEADIVINKADIASNLGLININVTEITVNQNDIVDLGINKADKVYVDSEINAIIGPAPAPLNTLSELSEAVDNDPLFSATIRTEIAAKLDDTAIVTKQGNVFNGNDQLVKLDTNGKLPAIDGSQLVNLPGLEAGAVNSVNGYQGNVVLDADDIADGITNKYYTEAKVDANTNVAANTAHRSSDGSDHSFIDQDVTQLATPAFKSIKFDVFADSLEEIPGELYYDSLHKTLTLIGELGNKLQIGQELGDIGVNKTGFTVLSGKAVSFSTPQGHRPTFQFADASIKDLAGLVGVTTTSSLNNEEAVITTFGIVHDVDTTAWAVGTKLYLSDDGSGDLVSTIPTAPSFIIWMGTVLESHITQGTIFVSPRLDYTNGIVLNSLVVNTDLEVSGDIIYNGKTLEENYVGRDLVNGTFTETFDALIVMGATIDLTLEQVGGGDLTMQFSDGNTVLDCTPIQSIQLTPGTATIPQENYIYVLKSTKLLTVSTIDWPAEEHIRVSYVLVLDVSNTDGPLINQNWNDHLSNPNDMGHIPHITQWMRHQGSTWFEGVNPIGTEQYLTIVGSTIYFKSGSGVIGQVHPHTFLTKDTDPVGGNDDIHIPNHPTPYLEIQNIADIVVDANGDTLTNKYYNLIVWGVANKGGTYDPLMITLPSGSYNNITSALNDVSNYDDSTILRQYSLDSSTGFLIARITLKNTSNTSWTHEGTVDLRGAKPGVNITGGTIGGIVFDNPDSLFRIYDTNDAAKVIAFDAGDISTGNTRVIKMADTNINLADIAANTSAITGKADTIHTHLEADITDLNKYTTSEVDVLVNAKADTVHTHVEGDITDLDKYTTTEIDTQMGLKADLVGGLVPANQLPSYVDDVLEYANLAAFPGTGETGKIYVAFDTNYIYRWTGASYIPISDVPSGADIKALYEGEADTNAFTDAYKSEVDVNTAKVGITTQQATDITTNNAKVGITTAQANEIIANNAKISADANATNQGNTFNGNSELVQTTADGKLPVIDGSNLTNLPSAGGGVFEWEFQNELVSQYTAGASAQHAYQIFDGVDGFEVDWFNYDYKIIFKLNRPGGILNSFQLDNLTDTSYVQQGWQDYDTDEDTTPTIILAHKRSDSEIYLLNSTAVAGELPMEVQSEIILRTSPVEFELNYFTTFITATSTKMASEGSIADQFLQDSIEVKGVYSYPVVYSDRLPELDVSCGSSSNNLTNRHIMLFRCAKPEYTRLP